MAIYVQVIITDDDTGVVKGSFVEHYGPGLGSYEVARALRAFFHRIFMAIFGQGEEWE